MCRLPCPSRIAVVSLQFIAVAVIMVAGRCMSQQVSVEIDPTEVSVHAFEPIFIRVVVKNLTNDPIPRPRRLQIETGVVDVDVQGPDNDRTIRKPQQVSKLSQEGPYEPIPPHGQQSTYFAILESNDPTRRIFPRPGVYKLSAVVTDMDRTAQRVIPSSVRIVMQTEVELRSAAAAAEQLALTVLPGAMSEDLTAAKLDTLAEKLSEGSLKQTVNWLAAIARIRESKTPDDLARTRKDIESRRERLPQVTREWVSLFLTRTYLRMDRLDLAAAESARLAQGNTQRTTLENQIRIKTAERADRRAKDAAK
jgi:hypothetical protein